MRHIAHLESVCEHECDPTFEQVDTLGPLLLRDELAGVFIKLLGSLDNLDAPSRHPALQGATLKIDHHLSFLLGAR